MAAEALDLSPGWVIPTRSPGLLRRILPSVEQDFTRNQLPDEWGHDPGGGQRPSLWARGASGGLILGVRAGGSLVVLGEALSAL